MTSPFSTSSTSSAALTTPELVAAFDDLQRRAASFELALSLMDYDAQTCAPAAGAASAGAAQAVLCAAQHELVAGPQTAELVAELQRRTDELDDLHAAELRRFARTCAEDARIPAELAADYKRLTTEAFPVWRAAKANDDFASFAPYLDRVFAMLKEQAICINPNIDPYDVWLDRWERGCSMEVCDRFFAQVGATVTPLVHAIAELGDAAQPNEDRVHALVPAADQQALAWDLARAIGLDETRLTFGLTEHPFTTHFDRTDVRIAHHYPLHDVLDGVSTSIHEGGHALYEQNVDPRYSFTCLASGASAAMHEGQSRLMENLVGRSRPFMEVLLPLLRTHAPQVAEGLTADELYRLCNVVRPGLIRTAADELTYPLHVLVRYECEKRLMDGTVRAADVPGLWRDLMREHLGVEVPSDTQGCLQDMHWAANYVGYFTSYALGNAYAAQLVAAARRAYAGDVDEAVSRGDLRPITGWLRENIWQHGRRYDPQDLLLRATGEPFDASYYTTYLSEKFGRLYGLLG
jgi:carboxypeptidase Taq